MLKMYETAKGEEKAFLALLKKRSQENSAGIAERVADVLNDVRVRGDQALYEYSEKFDKVRQSSLKMTEAEIAKAIENVPAALYQTLEKAAANISAYHEKQLAGGYEFARGGRTLGRIVRPLKRVGIYVPGGTAAYPSTVLMNVIPARVAGVREIIMVTPPKAEGVSPVVIAAAKIAGVTEIFTVGGAQAVAALAFGTETIPPVDKIVGPGNRYVAEAKRQVFGTVDIDMIAGPSEVLVIADDSANPAYVAADLLSQLEHDIMASAVLITPDRALANRVSAQIDAQLSALSRREIAEKSLADYSGAFIVRDMDEALRIANAVAPEHLEIETRNARALLPQVENAGSVFLGAYSSEPLGDYFAGTNHILPTNGTARFSSPLSVDSFVKKMSWMEYDRAAFLEDADDVIRFATSEGLTAHANAIAIRKEGLTK